jgi:hypothetical protein
MTASDLNEGGSLPAAPSVPTGAALDLFGQPAITVERKTSLFGLGLDELARRRGGWPDDALLFAVEVVGKGENPMVLATGGVPVGWKADGSPKFGKRADDLQAGFSIMEYRAALKGPSVGMEGEARNAPKAPPSRATGEA